MTLERARLVAGDDTVEDGNDDAVKLTVYLGRQERIGRPAGLTARSAICCIGEDSPVAQSFSASTAPHTASATGPRSSAATSTFR